MAKNSKNCKISPSKVFLYTVNYGFSLHKAAFPDAMALCYKLPSCLNLYHSAAFSVDHVLSYPEDGLPEIRSLTASLLTEICHQLQVKLELQAVSAFSLSTANVIHINVKLCTFLSFGVDRLNPVLWMSEF